MGQQNDELDVSDILNQTNSVLYEENVLVFGNFDNIHDSQEKVVDNSEVYSEIPSTDRADKSEAVNSSIGIIDSGSSKKDMETIGDDDKLNSSQQMSDIL